MLLYSVPMFPIKLVIFDLDGVLFDSKEIHFKALNSALEIYGDQFKISHDDHIAIFDGLSTFAKLEILKQTKHLPSQYFNSIWEKKQDFTGNLMSEVQIDEDLVAFMTHLKKEGNYKLCVASNSIRSTVETAISKLGILNFFDLILSNEDVEKQKPYPEIFWKAMSFFGTLPEETVIFEDSYVGRLAAQRSGANLIPLDSRADLTWEKIHSIKYLSNPLINNRKPWKSNNLNVVIPMAGLGSRFDSAGYTFPKPLIEVNGKPMIQLVVENLNIDAKFIFIVQKSQYDEYNLSYLLNLIAPNCEIITVEGVTEGSACTTLLAEKYINNDNPLLIANSDQFIEWDSSQTMYSFISGNIDGGIITFNSTHPKWSFVKVDEYGFVTEVAEKRPISDIATVGIYFWKHGSDYVKFANKMIIKNSRFNGEFYTCPVFNEAIQEGKKIKAKKIDKMWGLGTPEDLDFYLKNYKGI
jgi:HAD superfamily hydrolase (TIGR01509 family)